MNCPKCGHSDYYFGMLGHDCINPKCCFFKNGTLVSNHTSNLEITSTTSSRSHIKTTHNITVPLFNLFEQIYFDRGGGFSGTCDGFMVKGTISDVIKDSNNVLEYYHIYVEEDFLTDDGSFVGRGTTWSLWPEHVSERKS